MKSSNLLIEYQCPQCGAPATLEEIDRLFTCHFCRVKSYLLSRVYRYVLPHAAPKNRDLIFFPYWRFKGMLFSSVPGGVRERIIDVSHQAVQSRHFPVSVGLRSQTLKLRFVSPDVEGRFLKPSLPYEDMVRIIEERFAATLPKPIFDQCFVGENLSLLYAPFYVDSRVFDAVLNRPVSCELPDESEILSLPGGPPDWRIRFIPAQCPECGWDLEGERDSLALRCKNCDTLWQSGKKTFMKIQFGHFPAQGENVTYLPFWRIKADVTGIRLASYADMVRTANLPRVIQDDWAEQDFSFWAPAFKVRPKDFLTFSRNLTLSQPPEDPVASMPDAPLHPVTLSIAGAVGSLKATLASFMKPQDKLFPRLPEIETKPKSFVLVYVPFHQRGNELSQPSFRLRINKNLLAFARHL
ncbi:MAG: hypothetical protein ABII06_01330 [Pseudomonadota bacterium]